MLRLACATALALLLVGCAGREVASEPSVGQVEHAAGMDALDLVLVTDGSGRARLIGTLVNQADQPDRLVGLELAAEPAGWSVTLGDGPFVLREDEPFRLYRDAEVSVVSRAFSPGYRADVTLVFARADPITTTVPIETDTGTYSEIEVTRPPDGDVTPGERTD